MIRLHLLGRVSLVREDGTRIRSVLAQPKRFALLAYLAASRPPAPRRRDTLLGLFWPDSDTAHARKALRQSLYGLRKSLGPGVVTGKGDELVGIDSDRLWCDASAFERAISERRLEEALRLYGGPLLKGFYLDGAVGFERWTEIERRRLRLRALEAAWSLSGTAFETDDRVNARRWAERALELAPYDEEALRQHLVLMSKLGQPAAAVQAYEAFAERLAEDLDLRPTAETGELLDRVRKGERIRETPRTSEDTPDPPRTETRGPSSEAGGDAGAGGRKQEGGAEEPALPSPRPASDRSSTLEASEPIGRKAAVALLLLLAIAAAALARRAELGTADAPADLRPAERFVLSDFANHTADSLLGLTVTRAVRIDLSQSERVRLAEFQAVREALRRMRRDPEDAVTRAVAREIAIREGWGGAVVGSVRPAGSGYVLTAEVVAAEDGDILAGVRSSAENDDELLDAIDRLAKRLRVEIGESAAAVRSASGLREMTTHSLEALKRYTLAGHLMAHGGRYETIRNLLEEAIALDSTFALAYSDLSAHHFNAGDQAAGVATMRQAYRHREALPDRERWYLERGYHGRITGNAEKELAAWERLLEADPEFVAEHPGVWNGVGNSYETAGDVATAARYFRRHIEGDSLNSWMPYWNLAWAQVRLGRLSEAERTIAAYERLFDPAIEEVYGATPAAGRRLVAAARRNFERALRISRRLQRETRSPGHLAHAARLRATYAAATGRIREAEAATRVAVASALQADAVHAALAASLNMASVELWTLGDTAAALERLQTAEREYRLTDVAPLQRAYAWRARIYATAGQLREAQRLLEEERTAIDSVVHARHREEKRSEVLALIALAERAPRRALEHLRPIIREIGVGRGCRDDEYPCPLYTVARAYDQAGARDSAIYVYKRMLDAPYPRDGWLHFSDAWIAWYWGDALERLAALLQQAGRTDEAAARYAELVALWEECDAVLCPRRERAERLLAGVRGASADG
ncbi:MAG: BTAD domain-containing putative transcriptional regulator [Gemmatimonadota bacterium]|nr:BTAD domain-containing putative transcriptional regulator [Gemmatimonadota bacterium]